MRTALRLGALMFLALPACLASNGDPTGQIGQDIGACLTDSPQIEGVDVSVFQGTVDWTATHASGREFAITRLSNGTTLDSTFAANWAGIRAAGMIRGAYTYFEPGESPTAQADFVVSHVGRLGAGDLPFMADVEDMGGQSRATVIANLHTFLTAVQAGTGKVPMIYTGAWFWDGGGYLGGPSGFGSYPLVFSSYSSCGTAPPQWSAFSIWQYSDGSCAGCPRACTMVPGFSNRNPSACGNAPGTSVDRDLFHGSMAQLVAFAGGGAAWGATFVMQSFPYAAAGPITMAAGSTQTIWIEMRNSGTHAWDANTRLASTVPRDRVDPFADSTWITPSRPAGVPAGMTIAPGATYRFQFTLHAPATPGHFDEHFGLTEEGVAWFSDPTQGGPPDDQLEALIDVTAAAPHDGGPVADASPSDDAAPSDDASPSDDGGGSSDARVPTDGGAPADANDEGHDAMHPAGCACRAGHEGSARGRLAPIAVLGLGLLARRRRRG